MKYDKNLTVYNALVSIRLGDSAPYAYMTLCQPASVDDNVYSPAQSVVMPLNPNHNLDEFIASLIDLRICMELNNAKQPVGSSMRLRFGKHAVDVDLQEEFGTSAAKT